MKIFWFSGSGNSLWAAKKLAYSLKAELIPMVKYKNETEITVTDDVIGLVMPNFLGDLPWPAKEFLLKLRAPKDAYIFAVVVSGGVSSGVCDLLVDMGLRKQGLTLSLFRDLQMPGNCMASAADSEKDVLREAPKSVTDILGDIYIRKVNWEPQEKDPKKNYVTSTSLYKRSFLKRFKVNADACTGCGTCVKVCPMENITLRDKLPVHGKTCAGCHACVHWCPETAILVRAPFLKKRASYHNPNVRLKDMMTRG